MVTIELSSLPVEAQRALQGQQPEPLMLTQNGEAWLELTPSQPSSPPPINKNDAFEEFLYFIEHTPIQGKIGNLRQLRDEIWDE